MPEAEDVDLLAAMEAKEKALSARVAEIEREIRDLLPRLRAERTRLRAEVTALRGAIRAHRNAGKRPRRLDAEGNPSPQAMGGHARAGSMTPEQRSSQASKAARARWGSPRSDKDKK